MVGGFAGKLVRVCICVFVLVMLRTFCTVGYRARKNAVWGLAALTEGSRSVGGFRRDEIGAK